MAPHRLPLFPLNAVLFPGTPLPLHIFEARYRRLLRDCLAADRRFGVTPPGSNGEAPEPGTVGCTAEIRASEPLPDGRSNILVAGGSRFTVRQIIPDPAPYHVALVEEFDDAPDTPSPEAIAELREAFERYHRTQRLLQDEEPNELTLPSAPAALTFAIAAALDSDLGTKQRLLALRSTPERVSALLQLLPGLIRRAEAALQVHRRAPLNGRGRHVALPPES